VSIRFAAERGSPEERKGKPAEARVTRGNATARQRRHFLVKPIEVDVEGPTAARAYIRDRGLDRDADLANSELDNADERREIGCPAPSKIEIPTKSCCDRIRLRLARPERRGGCSNAFRQAHHVSPFQRIGKDRGVRRAAALFLLFFFFSFAVVVVFVVFLFLSWLSFSPMTCRNI